MNIHIVPHGKNTDHIKKGLRAYESVDKIYLLTSEKFFETSKNIQAEFEDFGFEVQIKKIDPFELRSVVDTIVSIAQENENGNLFINITGGTNLMAGGATSSAFFIGAIPYYVLEKGEGATIKDQVKELPVPAQPLYVDVGDMKREILEILWKWDQEGKAINSMQQICNELGEYPQKVSYHIKDLERKGLIEKEEGGRATKIFLTSAGKLYLRWTHLDS